MSKKSEVERFLKDFRVKLKVFDVVYIDREKNTQTLLDLELVPSKRKEALEQLTVEDYSEGPLEETMHGGSNVWVFGKKISGREIYIKVAMGQPSRSVICVSFHIAENPLRYPFGIS